MRAQKAVKISKTRFHS